MIADPLFRTMLAVIAFLLIAVTSAGLWLHRSSVLPLSAGMLGWSGAFLGLLSAGAAAMLVFATAQG
ncbi:MAG TPA: hypothetical protein VM265_10290 [Sphingomicrobium sp.]|nr:hypothetical protein [Sphingomicrobium sp.]